MSDNKSKLASYGGATASSTAISAYQGIYGMPMVTSAATAIGGAIVCGAGESAVKNFKCKDGDIGTNFHQNGFNVAKDGSLVSIAGKAYVGKSGLNVGAKVAGLELTDDTDIQISALKTGANLEVLGPRNLIDAGVEGKVIRFESGDGLFGIGLNVDTGVQIAKDKVKVEVLGFGFSVGEHGVGFKLPLFDINF
ncbi:unnamed protein product [Caenorhabditis angaria]|uniref:Uncharacterized protein n=1 Tax=Caenorhabditis angaria TaxID=860376 RepID=A0A9P1IKJ3_9PELO|nr:unnamed protein product [Caenorhabditis angaria]